MPIFNFVFFKQKIPLNLRFFVTHNSKSMYYFWNYLQRFEFAFQRNILRIFYKRLRILYKPGIIYNKFVMSSTLNFKWCIMMNKLPRWYSGFDFHRFFCWINYEFIMATNQCSITMNSNSWNRFLIFQFKFQWCLINFW